MYHWRITMSHLGVIRFTTHAVHVSQNEEGRIRCFKYNRNRCDYETFDNSELASEYIIEPLPEYYCEVVVSD